MNALIIYDDFAGAAKATTALRQSAFSANVTVEWHIKPWRTDVLRHPSAGNEALIEAVDADLIVFVGSQASSLPTWLEEWLRRWVIHRDVEDAALAVLYHHESAGVLVTPDALQLSQFAERHGLSFISENQTTLQDQTLPFPHALSVHKWPASPVAEIAVPIPSSYRDLGISN